MRNMALPLTGAIVILPLLHGIAEAGQPGGGGTPTPQARTYVSGVGSDSNPCTASSPCKTFQAALALTTAGGEIYVLNSANYGPVTINKAVTITSEGAVAGVLTSTGVAITVSAGPNDVVNLRGLDIDGGSSASTGIQFASGQSLNVQKTTIRNFTGSGLSFAPSASTTGLYLADTTIVNNGSNGVMVSPTASAAVNGALNRVVASGNGLASNGVGIFIYGGGTKGAVNVTLTDTVASNNYYGIGVTSSSVMIRNSTSSNNSVGIRADQAAIAQVGQSTITGNGTGWVATNGALLQSYGNNNVGGNGTDGTPTSTLALQ